MKKQLRTELRKKRALLENKELMSGEIAVRFLESELYKNSGTVLLYFSVGSEVSTGEIFKKALSDGKKVAFPVCENGEGAMSFYFVRSEEELEEGMYSIPSPKKECEKFISEKNALCIVPGLSFDKKGYRLGYGKGYYDRFLSSFEGLSVGLCYESMLCEELPTDDFDKNVDCLITDKKIYNFNC